MTDCQLDEVPLPDAAISGITGIPELNRLAACPTFDEIARLAVRRTHLQELGVLDAPTCVTLLYGRAGA